MFEQPSPSLSFQLSVHLHELMPTLFIPFFPPRDRKLFSLQYLNLESNESLFQTTACAFVFFNGKAVACSLHVSVQAKKMRYYRADLIMNLPPYVTQTAFTHALLCITGNRVALM